MLFFIVSKIVNPNESRKRICLRGLDENMKYEINDSVFYGSELMNFGLEYLNDSDFKNKLLLVKKTNL